MLFLIKQRQVLNIITTTRVAAVDGQKRVNANILEFTIADSIEILLAFEFKEPILIK